MGVSGSVRVLYDTSHLTETHAFSKSISNLRTLPLYSHIFSSNRRVKQPGREANHSPPSSTEVKNVWSCTFTPPNTFSWRGLNKAKYTFY
jgi:hypothetical protein